MGLSLFRILLCIILTKTGLSTQINDDGVVYQSFIYHLCHDGKAQSNLLVTCYMALDVLSRITFCGFLLRYVVYFTTQESLAIELVDGLETYLINLM